MGQTQFAFIHSAEIEQYHYPESCPFKTERAALTRSILISGGSFTGENRAEIAPRPLSDREMTRFHTREYIGRLKRVSSGKIDASDLFAGLGTADTPIFGGLYSYAALAGGGTLTAAGLILDAGVKTAFNPSGGYHHAFADKAGGFCYVNDVVLACMALAKAGKKVFCLDLDVHHGNGTQAAFYGDPQVFTLSLHESGATLFPWGGFETEIGEGEGRGFNVNVPLPAGTDDALYCRVFNEIVPPLLAAIKPDVIVLELGMDVLSTDPLAHFKMTNNAFADLLPQVTKQGIPILAVGGGGYNPENTARGWALLWTVLCGIEPESDMSIGMGGVFLGNAEWNAGLRDMKIYVTGDEKERNEKEADRVVEYVKKTVFPIHGI
ncbi:MAG TPA: acetoin utilization protein AcuC [Chitinivibrionales bacterium]|jgi:acetoin utilization protein AcuC|nr:acetoin utilization protein AcuC [Chitinivibrionales bacterium]